MLKLNLLNYCTSPLMLFIGMVLLILAATNVQTLFASSHETIALADTAFYRESAPEISKVSNHSETIAQDISQLKQDVSLLLLENEALQTTMEEADIPARRDPFAAPLKTGSPLIQPHKHYSMSKHTLSQANARPVVRSESKS